MRRFLILVSSALIIVLSFTSFSSDGFEISKQIEIFVSFYKKLNQNYVDEINPAKVMSTAIQAITKDLDPYTKFWTEQDIEASKIRSSGQYSGIGAELITKKERLFISQVYKGFAADKSGIKPGDEILKIDEILVSEYEGSDIKELIKGEKGSEVTLTYLRQGKKSNVIVKRDLIEINAVPFYKLLDDNTAYIVLQKFNQKASSQTIMALKELKAAGADKVILDLRDNPGGLLSEAVNVCNIFLPKNQLIVHTESVVNEFKKVYKTKYEPIDIDIPLVVLINGRSASASEIVSGVIQDLDRGVVVGARSFGKGLVQSTRPLKYNTLLKVTTSRYFIPTGRCIQALDYWNKDENGKPIRTKDINYKPFKTIHSGRTVYDGGGVLPDVEVDLAKRSSIANSLISERVIFDFVTNYYYTNKVKEPSSFQFTSNDYQKFLNYVKNGDYIFETKTETALQGAMLNAIKDDLDNNNITTKYNELIAEIEKTKNSSLKDRAKEITTLLTNEILKRYFYQEGMREYDVVHSEEIKKAQEVLGNPTQYSKILGN